MTLPTITGQDGQPRTPEPVVIILADGTVLTAAHLSGGGGGGAGAATYPASALTPVGVVVTDALTELLAADPARKEAWFTNADAGVVWCSDDGDAAVRGAGCTPVAQYQTFFAAAPTSRITAIKDTGSIDCLLTGQGAS